MYRISGEKEVHEKKLVFDHVTLMKVQGQIHTCQNLPMPIDYNCKTNSYRPYIKVDHQFRK